MLKSNGITGPWELEGNDGVFAWSAFSYQSLVLTSDQGHTVTLGSDYGRTRFPLDLSGTHVDQYDFVLTASSSLGEVFDSVVIDYDETPAPILESLSFWVEESVDHTVLYLQVSWETVGADTMDIGYLPSGGTPGSETLFVEDFDANLELLSGVDVSALPPDSDLIIIFRNQYGSTYRQFPFSGCPEGAWLNDSGICELVPL